MKPPAPRSRATSQLNLPLLQGPTGAVPSVTQAELILALVELLIGAARVSLEDGVDDASKAHR
jgi:hypothetical protein